jgi:hypothetical protein
MASTFFKNMAQPLQTISSVEEPTEKMEIY